MNAETKEKAMINDEMAYFFGLNRGSYGEILGDQSRMKVNSCRTSSIPLTEFWQPANLGDIKALFTPYLPTFDPEVALKFFEFPTEAKFAGKIIGRPSMTDIMILDSDWQIAIEGKFTEYRFADEKSIIQWLRECTAGVDVMFRRNVLRAWLGYIKEARCTDLISIGELCTDCKSVAYQFLHRTASACHMTNGTEGRTPVLVYQVFFDAQDAQHVAAMRAFKANLRQWSTLLKLKNMKFLILTVPVTNAAEVESRFGNQHGEIFDAMRDETIYRFDFGGIQLEEVVK